MPKATRIAIAYVTLCVLGILVYLPFRLVGAEAKTPIHRLPECPPLGAHLRDDPKLPIVVAEDDFAANTYPIGRQFVLLRCHR